VNFGAKKGGGYPSLLETPESLAIDHDNSQRLHAQ
jgi:hypothetical protein